MGLVSIIGNLPPPIILSGLLLILALLTEVVTNTAIAVIATRSRRVSPQSSDFFKVGRPLQLLLWLTLSVALWWLYL